MAFERISKQMEALDGSFVFAQFDPDTSIGRVICSGCPQLKNTAYKSRAGAILAASYHADHDPDQRHVPTR